MNSRTSEQVWNRLEGIFPRDRWFMAIACFVLGFALGLCLLGVTVAVTNNRPVTAVVWLSGVAGAMLLFRVALSRTSVNGKAWTSWEYLTLGSATLLGLSFVVSTMLVADVLVENTITTWLAIVSLVVLVAAVAGLVLPVVFEPRQEAEPVEVDDAPWSTHPLVLRLVSRRYYYVLLGLVAALVALTASAIAGSFLDSTMRSGANGVDLPLLMWLMLAALFLGIGLGVMFGAWSATSYSRQTASAALLGLAAGCFAFFLTRPESAVAPIALEVGGAMAFAGAGSLLLAQRTGAREVAVESSVRIEANPKWIRGVVDGRTVVDSRRSRFVWEVPYYPAWYFPVDDVAAELVTNGEVLRSPSRGEGVRYDLVVGDRTLVNAAWRHVDSPVSELRDLVRIEWDALDTWFEEDVEVFVHPRSPEVRVDALLSSRHVRVLIAGHVVADSARPTVLYETGLPPRYYLPKSDVGMNFLTPTELSTACPYKGRAEYWTVEVGGVVYENLAWGYRAPLPESEPIAGMVCFYNEKVDIEVDGITQERPKTKFG